MNHTERPCADAGLASYRYGYIMISAIVLEWCGN